MNTFTTFFASIITLFSSLLGYSTPVKEQFSPSQVVAQQRVATSSIVVTGNTGVQNIKPASNSGMTKFIEFRGGDRIQRESETTMIRNDPVATINSDFISGVDIVYITKDKSKIYFVLYRETEGQECVYLNYLDTVKSQYFNTKLDYCPGDGDSPIEDEAKDDALPFVVQYGKFDFDKLYALNLETEKEIVIYSKKNNNESLIARCADGTYDFAYLPDIESLGKKRLRIGVYKESADIAKSCTREESYTKVRDDIINLNEQI